MIGYSVENTPSLELIALSSVWFLSTNFWEVLSRQQQQRQQQQQQQQQQWQQIRFRFSSTFSFSGKIYLKVSEIAVSVFLSSNSPLITIHSYLLILTNSNYLACLILFYMILYCLSVLNVYLLVKITNILRPDFETKSICQHISNPNC